MSSAPARATRSSVRSARWCRRVLPAVQARLGQGALRAMILAAGRGERMRPLTS